MAPRYRLSVERRYYNGEMRYVVVERSRHGEFVRGGYDTVPAANARITEILKQNSSGRSPLPIEEITDERDELELERTRAVARLRARLTKGK